MKMKFNKFEMKSSSLKQEIDDYERQEADLKTSIGWQEVYHNTDTSESMKNYVSKTIKTRNEQKVLKQQIERAIDENQIEQNTLSQEIENLEKIWFLKIHWIKRNNIINKS